mmetsp:Transcript_688/g.1279  ORF Transcript_688/g.1279 Transcript_688/m.1279 type:complete len:112 (+) Transcript_688:384-719(+)
MLYLEQSRPLHRSFNLVAQAPGLTTLNDLVNRQLSSVNVVSTSKLLTAANSGSADDILSLLREEAITVDVKSSEKDGEDLELNEDALIQAQFLPCEESLLALCTFKLVFLF